MTEDYVSVETAKLLKEKGFDEKCFYCFDDVIGESRLSKLMICNNSELVEHYYSAPTLQMAMKWLREVHNYDVGVCLDSYVEPYDNLYYIVIRRRKDKYENISPCEQAYYDTYEEACEAAIKYCLENLI
jgi:hypothetical protein